MARKKGFDPKALERLGGPRGRWQQPEREAKAAPERAGRGSARAGGGGRTGRRSRGSAAAPPWALMAAIPGVLILGLVGRAVFGTTPPPAAPAAQQVVPALTEGPAPVAPAAATDEEAEAPARGEAPAAAPAPRAKRQASEDDDEESGDEAARIKEWAERERELYKAEQDAIEELGGKVRSPDAEPAPANDPEPMDRAVGGEDEEPAGEE